LHRSSSKTARAAANRVAPVLDGDPSIGSQDSDISNAPST
jgi:hypothetical protein